MEHRKRCKKKKTLKQIAHTIRKYDTVLVQAWIWKYLHTCLRLHKASSDADQRRNSLRKGPERESVDPRREIISVLYQLKEGNSAQNRRGKRDEGEKSCISCIIIYKRMFLHRGI